METAVTDCPHAGATFPHATGQHHEPPADTDAAHLDDAERDAQQHRLRVELRNLVLNRLRLMNTRHAHHAWDRADTDPIAPHGLAYFYADHDPESRYGWGIRTAVRLLLEGPETAGLSLPELVAAQCRIAEDFRRAG